MSAWLSNTSAGPSWMSSLRIGRNGFEHRAIRTEIAVQHRQGGTARQRNHRIVKIANDIVVVAFGRLNGIAQCTSFDGDATESQLRG